jgi:hypothetical protein
MAIVAAMGAPNAAAGGEQPKGDASPAKEQGPKGGSPAAQAAPKGTLPGGDDRIRRAAELFDRATVLYESDRCAEAEPLYQEAWDLVKAHDIAANLGECELELGQAREAAEHLAYALRTSRISGKEEVRERLVKLLDEARQKAGTLWVAVNVEGAEVLVNGRSVGRAPIVQEVYVEPGHVTVEGKLPGYVPTTETLTVAAGQERQVQVTLVREATPPVERPAVPVPATATATAQKSMVPVYIGAGVAGAAVVTGLVLAAMSNGASTDANEIAAALGAQGGTSACNAPANAGRCRELRASLDRVDALANGSTAVFIIGAAALTGTVAYVLYWRAPEPKARAVRLEVTPAVAPRAAGMLVRGRF